MEKLKKAVPKCSPENIYRLKGDIEMSKIEEHSNRDFSRFDSMSTETLREILYQDSLLPEREGYDMDAILYILEVVNKREETEPTEKFTPVDDAWAQFNEHYRSNDCDGKSLYEFSSECDPSVSTILPFPTKEHSKPRKSLRTLLRVGCTAAALLIVLFAGSLSAYAMGFDLWGAVAQWTKDTFGFSTVAQPLEYNSIYPAGNDPRDLLKEYKITEDLLPTWLPDGYEFVGIEVTETPTRKVFDVTYSNNSSEIAVSITVLTSSSIYTYEKDNFEVLTYLSGGIDHYIMQNNGKISTIWVNGSCECSIIGNISLDDIQKIIDSIYRS